jgi:poly(3-hydroxybutyrate) depolymerase
MAIEIEVNGVLRQYDLLFPTGGEYWFTQCALQNPPRNGLPVVVALHGRGQRPEVLQAQWDFLTVANTSQSFDDKFVVLVPYGLAIDDKAAWNSHPEFQFTDPNDLAFLTVMLDHAETLVKEFLVSRGVTLGTPALGFDPKRKHLFGYSSGALMAFTWANSSVNTFASVVALAGANGAKSWQGATEYRYPPNGVGSNVQMSLWLAVGGLDPTNPPGTDAAPGPVTNPDQFTVSTTNKLALEAAGVPAPGDTYAYSVRKAVWTVQDFLAQNRNAYPLFPNNYLAPKFPPATQSGVLGTQTRTYRLWARAADVANNPRVRFDYDTAMNHTNMVVDVVNRWMTAGDVWTFMKTAALP